MATTTLQKEFGVVIALCLYSMLYLIAFAVLLPLALVQGGYTALLLLLSVGWLVGMVIALGLSRHAASIVALCIFPALLVIIVGRLSPVASGGALLLCLFTLLAQRTILREIQNRVSYRTTHMFIGGTRLLTLGLMIALTGLVWPTVSTSVQQTRFQISDRQVEPLLKPIEPLIRDFFPGYRKEASIDELINASIEEEKKQLPPGVTIDEQQLERSRAELRQKLGQELTGQESLSAIVAGMLNRQVNDIATQNPIGASLILIVLVFLTLRALLPIIVWPTMGLVAGTVWVGQNIGLVTLTRTQAMVERLHF